jgi:hypothetical protein
MKQNVKIPRHRLGGAGFRYQNMCEEPLSLLSDLRVVVNNAIDHANAYGPGLRPTVVTKLARDRRTGRKEECLLVLTERRENRETSPEIRRNHSGQLVHQATTYRVNYRYQGYSKYCSDA